MKSLVQFVFLTLFLSGCDQANPRTMKAWISASDTLVQNRVIKEQARIDSICMVKSEEYYKDAYDSIYNKRWAEMKLLLDSIKTK